MTLVQHHGGPIRFAACKAGLHDNGPAQWLANEMGVVVRAPTADVQIDEKGEFFLINDDEHRDENGDIIMDEIVAIIQGLIPEDGFWRNFEPNV